MTTSLKRFLAALLIILVQFIFISPQIAFAATSPSLGAAAGFSILGHTTVTNTGITTVAGDVGVYSGTAITDSGTLTVGPPGILHTGGDSPSELAQDGNTAAFLALSAGDNATCTNIPNELSGQNLVPGVYCPEKGDFMLSGTLTLSGSGVWIFRTGAALITSGTANVVGGDPCNVWWKVPSSATLGTGTSLIGNILASTSIWMNTGATLNGRAMAQTGEVTMDTNTISGPTCAAAAPVDICANIEGVQTSVPEGQHLDASGQNCVSFSQAGPPPQSGGTTSTGQVLGAKTLASTGSFNSIAGLALMIVGSIMTLGSLYAFKKKVI
jgi:hypothetical protein